MEITNTKVLDKLITIKDCCIPDGGAVPADRARVEFGLGGETGAGLRGRVGAGGFDGAKDVVEGGDVGVGWELLGCDDGEADRVEEGLQRRGERGDAAGDGRAERDQPREAELGLQGASRPPLLPLRH